MQLPLSTRSARMSVLFIPTMMPIIMGLPTREETYREKKSA